MAKKATAAATPPAFKPVVIPIKPGWIATDANGGLWWYKSRPGFENVRWYAGTPNLCKCLYCGKKISKQASAASLVEIKKASKLELRLVTE